MHSASIGTITQTIMPTAGGTAKNRMTNAWTTKRTNDQMKAARGRLKIMARGIIFPFCPTRKAFYIMLGSKRTHIETRVAHRFIDVLGEALQALRKKSRQK